MVPQLTLEEFLRALASVIGSEATIILDYVGVSPCAITEVLGIYWVPLTNLKPLQI